MINETYQELMSSQSNKAAESSFATIGTVYSDGITLIFDGQTAATTKRYKANTTILFTAGQRVKVTKDSGTYIVEYPVGNPRTS